MCLCVLGNLDEKVDERVLYEIMVQAGPLVDLHMPRDKETKRHKGYAFAEFTTEKSALYAVNLFSGLVFLHKKLLRFSISGQDKVVQTPPQEVRDLKMSESLGDTNIQYPQRLPMPMQSTPVGYCNSPVGSFSATRTVSLLGYPSAKAQPSYPGVGQRLEFSPPAHSQNSNAFVSAARPSYPGVGQRLEFSPLAHTQNYNALVSAAQSDYPGVGQRLEFSPLAHTQVYNAHLVSLGQAGLRSNFHSFDQAIANRSF